jgi:hypothetical protein
MAEANRPLFDKCPSPDGECGFDIVGNGSSTRAACALGMLCRAPGAEAIGDYMGEYPQSDDLGELIAHTAAHDPGFAAGVQRAIQELQGEQQWT